MKKKTFPGRMFHLLHLQTLHWKKDSNEDHKGRRMRSMQELYDATDNQESAIMFAFFTGEDPISYDVVIKEEKCRQAMKEEIKAIEKNNTWELTDLPLKKNSIGVK